MGQHQKKKAANYSKFLFSLAMGVLSMFVLTLAFAAAFAAADLPSWVIDLFAFLILIVGCGVSGWCAGVAYRRTALWVGTLCGVSFAVILLVGNLLFFHSAFSWQTILKYLVMIGASFLGAFLVKPLHELSSRKRRAPLRKETLS